MSAGAALVSADTAAEAILGILADHAGEAVNAKAHHEALLALAIRTSSTAGVPIPSALARAVRLTHSRRNGVVHNEDDATPRHVEEAQLAVSVLALEHAAARLDDAEYLARMARLRGELEIVGTQPARDLRARRAVEWLDALAETWQTTDLVEGKSSRGRASSACASHRPRTDTDWRSRCQMLLWRARQVLGTR